MEVYKFVVDTTNILCMLLVGWLGLRCCASYWQQNWDRSLPRWAWFSHR